VRETVPPGESLLALIAGADVIFYMAGSSTPASASRDPGGSIIRHVVPAAAVLDLMRETRTRRIVLASSGGTVYGAASKFPTPETHPTKPINLHGQHSLTIERYAQFFAERYGFETVILRFANPYGPGQVARRGQGVVAAWSHALARAEPLVVFGDPDTRRDFVYIDDVVEAAASAGFQAPPGVYNVGSGEARRLADVICRLLEVAGRDVEVVHADPRPVDVPMTQLDCTRMAEAVGWRPAVPLYDGIRATWEWTLALSTVSQPA
jgi:UDP-glucose 4-epimerase